MKKRIVGIVFWGVLLTQTADFSSLCRVGNSFKDASISSLKLGLASCPARPTFEGMGFQVLGTQKVNRVHPIQQSASGSKKTGMIGSVGSGALALAKNEAKKIKKAKKKEKLKRKEATAKEQEKDKAARVSEKPQSQPVMPTSQSDDRGDLPHASMAPTMPFIEQQYQMVPLAQQVPVSFPMPMPQMIPQPVMPQPVTYPYYQQPAQPMMPYYPPQQIYGQQPQLAAIAMQMQAQAMAIQSQASVLMMQAQQHMAYPQYQPMMQPAYQSMQQPISIPSLGDVQRMTKQEKMQKLMAYLQQIAQTGMNDIHRLLSLIEIELDIVESLLANATGQTVDRLVFERNQIVRQSGVLIAAAYDLIIDIASTGSQAGSDSHLYQYFVRKGKKQRQQPVAPQGRKKFLTEMITILQQEYEMIENMERVVSQIR